MYTDSEGAHYGNQRLWYLCNCAFCEFFGTLHTCVSFTEFLWNGYWWPSRIKLNGRFFSTPGWSRRSVPCIWVYLQHITHIQITVSCDALSSFIRPLNLRGTNRRPCDWILMASSVILLCACVDQLFWLCSTTLLASYYRVTCHVQDYLLMASFAERPYTCAVNYART